MVDKLFAIIEVDSDGNEKFFNGLLQAGDYNKTYKLSVFKYEKTAQNRLDVIQKNYQSFIDNDHAYNHYRIIGELYIKEFTSCQNL